MNEEQGILPESGIWTVEAFAKWLGVGAREVQQKLSDEGVQVISFSSRYRHRIFRLEDLKKK